MELNVSVGQMVFVERRLGNNRVKGNSKILGARSPRYLMLDMPMASSGPVITTAGQKCIIRFLRNGTMVGFWANVLKINSEPFPMVVVEYAPNVEEVIVRHSERVNCNISTNISIQLPKPMSDKNNVSSGIALQPPDLQSHVFEFRGFIVDLSRGGCLLAVPLNSWKYLISKIAAAKDPEALQHEVDECYDPMARGNAVQLDFELPTPAQISSCEVAGQIRWITRESVNAFIGVQFTNPNAILTQDIQRIIEHQKEFFTRRFEFI